VNPRLCRGLTAFDMNRNIRRSLQSVNRSTLHGQVKKDKRLLKPIKGGEDGDILYYSCRESEE
jgi:hypothetical protein